MTKKKNNFPFLPHLFLGAVLVGLYFSGQALSQAANKSVNYRKVLAAKTPVSPHLKTDAATPPTLSAKSVYAFDVDDRTDLFSKNPNTPSLPASTTKIATALVALAHYNLSDVITVGSLKIDGHKMDLQEGEKITVANLLYGLLVFSANDAAEVLAQNYPGGQENFVAAMNKLASTLGLSETNFTNPVGFDEYLHFSSAYDLARLGEYAMENPIFAKMAQTTNLVVKNVDGSIEHKLVNTNELIGKVPGVLGVKTGWTEDGGESLVTFVSRDGHRIIISLLGSSDRFGETEKIINWIFENYSWE